MLMPMPMLASQVRTGLSELSAQFNSASYSITLIIHDKRNHQVREKDIKNLPMLKTILKNSSYNNRY